MTSREDFPETCILVLLSGPGGMATDFCLTAFRGKGLPVETLDAADPDNKAFRAELFEISGVRGNYPQVFRLDEDEITFIGEHQKIQRIAERGQIGLVISGDYDEDDDEESSEEEETDEEEGDEEEEDDDDDDDDDDEAETEEEAPKKKGMFGMFGRKKKEAVTDEASPEVEEVPKDEEEVAVSEAPKKKGMFAMFGKKKKEEVPDENAEEDEEALKEPEQEEPAEEGKPKKKGMFGMFGKKKEAEETKDDGEPDFADVTGTDNINDPEAGGPQKDDEPQTYDESVTAAMRDFQEKNQGDKVKLYGLLIKFFSAGVCLATCAIIVIVVFIILD